MGSQSDMAIMQEAATILEKFNINFETKIISAHRTPDRLYKYCQDAKENNIDIIIAGAGGAAHLPGMVASMVQIPVLGVPIKSESLKGLDSLLSIAQMPFGIPVATLAIGKPGAKNAALLAASILSISNQGISKKLSIFRKEQTNNIKLEPIKVGT